MNPTDIFAVIQRLNWNYGKGDVKFISYNKDNTGGKVQVYVSITQTTGYNYFRKYRIKNGTVYFAGHQKKVPVI